MLKQQAGVGLLEVMIALLILALAVLGFSAMQMRAVKATDETLYRSDALVAVRNVSEDIRLYPTQKQRDAYKTAINAGKTTLDGLKNCSTVACTDQEQITYNAALSTSLAASVGVTIRANDCPGINEKSAFKKMCLVAAWGDTNPTMAGTIEDKGQDCTDSAGVYKPGATCFVVETY